MSKSVGVRKVRHFTLLTDTQVRAWYDERCLRSRLSADADLRKLGLLLERLRLTPRSVVNQAKKAPDTLRGQLVSYASDLKRTGHLDSYILKSFGGLKSWLEFERVGFDRYPKLSPIRGASLSKERVPTPEELGRVLEHLSLRGRVIALFLSHAGVRPGVLGSYRGESGLRLSDLPDLRLQRSGVTFRETPFVVRVPASLSKTRASYTTFGSSQLATTFLEYLAERKERSEDLQLDSPVVASNPTRGVALQSQEAAQFSRGFLTTKAVVEEIREALESSVPDGVHWRPYVLRAYCSTRLLMAEGAGKMTRDLREAIMGHDLGVSGRYTLGKSWGEDLLREARVSYKRAESFLSTTGVAQDSQEGVTRALKLLLAARGVPAEKLESIDLANKTDEEIVALLKTVGAALGPEEREERTAAADEVPKLLAEGWKWVGSWNGTGAVLRAPLPGSVPSRA